MAQSASVFISHASADDAVAAELRKLLEEHGIPVWVDSRVLRPGDKLEREDLRGVEEARQVLVVLGPATVNSAWVRKEIKHALTIEQKRKDDGYRVIPLLLPGLTEEALGMWFDEEPLAISLRQGHGGVADAAPFLLAALGKQLPEDIQAADEPDAAPIEELVLVIRDSLLRYERGMRRLTAKAELVFEPSHIAGAKVESKRFWIEAPLGPIEADDLRWYLEEYYRWPIDLFLERAEDIEKKLPQWGQALYKMALGTEAGRTALEAWRLSGESGARRFSVHVDQDLPDQTPEEELAAAREAAAAWLALPWELLHDGRAFLFQGALPVRVRRRVPNRDIQPLRTTSLPIRVLLLSPRPEQTIDGRRSLGFIDPRVSAKPLVEAVEALGELVELTRLEPPTRAALGEALRAARKRGQPFDVVHFDGHGTWSKQAGLGGLYFELADDAHLPVNRRAEFVDADALAGLFLQHRVPLVFLEACQTAQAEHDSTASVAARLLRSGIPSVVAMSHSVLVETARIFVQAFYRALAQGERVGESMLAGQTALYDNTSRGTIPGAGPLRLQDWFVPVIYQERYDPQLITRIPGAQVQRLAAQRRQARLGALPPEPPHKFQGRRRELLRLERLLFSEPHWLVLQGIGGQGKTALASELARWLVHSRRLSRVAFVSLEQVQGAGAVLDTLGHQLLPQGKGYSVAQYPSLDHARLPVERALRDSERGTILIFDNVESMLHELGTTDEALPAIFDLAQTLLATDPRTCLVFTSRTPLHAPFDDPGRLVELSALLPSDAVDLVREVLTHLGKPPPHGDAGRTPTDLIDLVESVDCHPRALVLLAREVAQRGVRAATADLTRLMADLDQKHPGDRENSLYASVELSLRKLSAKHRQAITQLAVCQGGIHIGVLMRITGLGEDETRKLGAELIFWGLGEDCGNGHMRLDPGLPPYLLRSLSAEVINNMRTRFAEAMAGLTDFLYKQRFENTQLASELTQQELPNLLGMLDWHAAHSPAERVIVLAQRIEHLVAILGRQQALARASRIREQASRLLGAGWTRSRFNNANATIDRLLERSELPQALVAAKQLLAASGAAGPSAYPDASYDLALAHCILGRVLRLSGNAEAALPYLQDAQTRFQCLADVGDAEAEQMVSGALTEKGTLLLALGRLDAAATAYEQVLARSQDKERLRPVAIAKSQLGTVRLYQKRYSEALVLAEEARNLFSQLNEPRTIATAWHQIGMVHHQAGQRERAETAYRESLALRVQDGDVSGQAIVLGQLGSLYDQMDRVEDAATLYQQAADIFVKLKDVANEGRILSNRAGTLIKLNRHADARAALQRAIECLKPFGHAAHPWKAWALLAQLESAVGSLEASRAARQHAEDAYRSYRQAGGESHSNNIFWFARVFQSIREDQVAQAVAQLEALRKTDDPPFVRALSTALVAILHGSRSLTLAEEPELDLMNSVEVRLLLATLSQTS